MHLDTHNVKFDHPTKEQTAMLAKREELARRVETLLTEHPEAVLQMDIANLESVEAGLTKIIEGQPHSNQGEGHNKNKTHKTNA